MSGLVHIYMGHGKGKTTAATGLAIRAAGRDKKVIFMQFLKGGESGEINILNKINNVEVIRNTKDFGFVKFLSDVELAELIAMQKNNYNNAISYAKDVDMIVFDEIFAAIKNNTFDKMVLHEFLNNKPKHLEVVLTGHDVDDDFIAKADYVTEMKKIKHPYDEGIKARIGIEM